MSTSHVIYLYFDTAGADLRAMVLRTAGYQVDECCSLPEFADKLRSDPNADLVCIAERQNWPAEGALALTRGLSCAPVVLFRAAPHHYIQRTWDLEIQPLTPPGSWLLDIADLLAGSRETPASARRLKAEAKRLRADATLAHAQTARLRDDIQEQCERKL